MKTLKIMAVGFLFLSGVMAGAICYRTGYEMIREEIGFDEEA